MEWSISSDLALIQQMQLLLQFSKNEINLKLWEPKC